MKWKLCHSCNTEGWHNPMKQKKASDEQQHRCCTCGAPRPTGNIAPKNIVEKRWNGVFFGGVIDAATAKALNCPTWATQR